MSLSQYPATRMRRNRASAFSRKLTQETSLSSSDLIYPVFIMDSENESINLKSMPGQKRHGLSSLMKTASACVESNIPAIALFPSLAKEEKYLDARSAYDENSLVPRAIKRLKQNFPNLGIITDIALDPYTPHGQDGLLSEDGKILNDETISILCQQALCYAEAGADVVAPSDMMDGRIGRIRESLETSGFFDTQILAYTAKYASHLYAPFRDAVGSVSLGQKIDKRTYQMNPGNLKEALHEAALDINEGADILMVKPAMLYCDVIKAMKDRFEKPTFAYQVSGEFAMIKAACTSDGLIERDLALEALLCIKRAGADAILSYYALEASKWIREHDYVF